MFEEYAGQISSLVAVDDFGNPTQFAEINTFSNSFNVKINVQFFNLIPNVNYSYLLEVDAAINITGEANVPKNQKIGDVQLKAKSGYIGLKPENTVESAKVSRNGYNASAVLNIDDVPIYQNHPLTFKIKMTFGALVDNQNVDWQIFSTFISLPENAFREGLPIPRNIPFVPNESTNSND